MPKTPEELDFVASPRIALSVFPWSDLSLERELKTAESRNVTLKRSGRHTASFTMSGDEPESEGISELVTDLMVRIDGSDVLRARCGKITDNAGADNFTSNFPFIDYRGVLSRRHLRTTHTLAYDTDQSNIAWGMISDAQGVTNGDYGITRGVGTSTGRSREWNPIAGNNIEKEIQSMADRDGGFDWEIGPGMTLDIWSPGRGTDRDVSVEYGKTVRSFSRSRSVETYGNSGLITGDENLTIVESSTAGVDTDPRGVWDFSQGFPGVTIQDSLNDRMAWEIDVRGNVVPAYTLLLMPGFWRGLSHIGLGDTIRIRIKRGRLNEVNAVKVNEINIADDGNGGEQVTLTVGSI
jgi:hypothetical protein